MLLMPDTKTCMSVSLALQLTALLLPLLSSSALPSLSRFKPHCSLMISCSSYRSRSACLS